MGKRSRGKRKPAAGRFTNEAFALPISPIHAQMSKGEILKAKDRWDKAVKAGKPVAWRQSYADGRPSEVVMWPIPQPAAETKPGRPRHPLTAQVLALKKRDLSPGAIAKLLSAKPGPKISRSTVRLIFLAAQ